MSRGKNFQSWRDLILRTRTSRTPHSPCHHVVQFPGPHKRMVLPSQPTGPIGPALPSRCQWSCRARSAADSELPSQLPMTAVEAAAAPTPPLPCLCRGLERFQEDLGVVTAPHPCIATNSRGGGGNIAAPTSCSTTWVCRSTWAFGASPATPNEWPPDRGSSQPVSAPKFAMAGRVARLVGPTYQLGFGTTVEIDPTLCDV